MNFLWPIFDIFFFPCSYFLQTNPASSLGFLQIKPLRFRLFWFSKTHVSLLSYIMFRAARMIRDHLKKALLEESEAGS